MSDDSFGIDEFMKTPEQPVVQVAELDVQKVVVEELAAEKAEMHEGILKLENRVSRMSAELEDAKRAIAAKNLELEESKKSIKEKDEEINVLKKKIGEANAKIAYLDATIGEKLIKELDQQERNPNALALLDRDVELPDRFVGETRDHVLEVLKEARDAAEKEGRRRRAQLLEGVLVANEPSGNLAKRRADLEKVFKDNANVINGAVMRELDRLGIQYKEGDEYLLPKEILLRTY